MVGESPASKSAYVRSRRPKVDVKIDRLPEVFVPQQQAPKAEGKLT